MKHFKNWYHSLSTKDMLWLTTIFLASLLATAVSGLILKWGMAHYGEENILARITVSIVATAAYAVVVLVVFNTFFPETKMALKQLWRKK